MLLPKPSWANNSNNLQQLQPQALLLNGVPESKESLQIIEEVNEND